ncbi:MAG: glutamate--tRNA ligase [Bacteriovoracaceae bacterium]|nr:glutamate--tRNA ligase [Bacteriovoracaceae bacterium]
MSARVRFAPSPTGYLHIGGARTAIYNYLFAKANNGTLILRIEDTDLERSKREYEVLQVADLKWLGIEFDESPEKPGKYGPYRQSERTDIYLKYAQMLVDKGLAYYDFCTDAELEAMKERATQEGRPPHYDGKWKNEKYWEEAQAKLAAGEKGAIRFKASQKSYILNDRVRGRIVFPENMVGDFVLIRSNGQPVYNFCCVVDDMLMKITHVIRGEDHLSNTLRQMMLYEAFDATIPEMVHVSLLIGNDRQKLSKRHGATSVNLYREESYAPQALVNYLCLLGWSHPEEKDIFTLQEIAPVFNLDRFSKSPAIYDIEKLKWVNGQHLRKIDNEILVKQLDAFIDSGHWFHKQPHDWKIACIALFKEQIQFFQEIIPHLEALHSKELVRDEKLNEILSWPTTPQIAAFLSKELEQIKTHYVEAATFNQWMDKIKTELKIKGKPLFMGVRVSLTGHDHGPELNQLIPLTPVDVLKARVKNLLT